MKFRCFKLVFKLCFLLQSKGFSTLKGELLPYVIKKQMSCPATHSDNEKLMSDVNVNVKIDDIFNVCCDTMQLDLN